VALIGRAGGRDRASSTQAVAGEIDAVGVVDETVEDGVGVSRIAEDLMMPSFLIVWCIADAREAE
jgi:hypothetical protein